MTQPDLMKLLENKVVELGQAQVARMIGYKDSAICNLLKGKYKAAPDAILQRVREVFGAESVICPVLGEISLGQCADERKKPFAATSHQRVALWKACQKCEHNGGKP